MTNRVAAIGLMMTIAGTVSASGQSLAELARQEEARRKAVRTPAKVYTNESIRGGTPASPPPAAPQPGTSSATASAAAAPAAGSGAPATAEATTAVQRPSAPPAEEPKGEAYWRKRIQAERDALARAQLFAEALQSRINVLSADFVARDDPAQRAVIATDRQKALAELDRVRQEIAQHTRNIAGIQDEARRASVPPGWLR